jgi:hypothetical protein
MCSFLKKLKNNRFGNIEKFDNLVGDPLRSIEKKERKSLTKRQMIKKE